LAQAWFRSSSPFKRRVLPSFPTHDAMRVSSLLSFVALASAQDVVEMAWDATKGEVEVMVEGDVVVEFMGKSGEFNFQRTDGKGEQGSKTEVRLKRVSVVEADDVNNAKVCFTEDIAGKTFTAKGEDNFKLPGDIKCDRRNFTAALSFGKVLLDTYLIKGEGTTGLDKDGAEQFSVERGSVKFNLELSEFSSWETSGCSGTHVDVELEIKSNKMGGSKKDGGRKKGKGGKKGRCGADLGNEFELEMTQEVLIDDSLTMMPAGFPMDELKDDGKGHEYTFRFPRFQNRATYDPIISDATEDTETGGAKNVLAFTALAVPLLRVIFA